MLALSAAAEEMDSRDIAGVLRLLPKPKVFPASVYIERYAEMHRELFSEGS
jgi:hypothetical protein